MKDVALLNGEIVGMVDARVSILDRANLFGDGLYEVVRCYSGRLYKLDTHIRRLLAAARKLGIRHDHTHEQLTSWANRLADDSGVAEGEMYMQLSRGPAVRTHYFPDPASAQPTIFMTLRPVRPIPPEARTDGTAVITCPDMRHGWCHLKTLNLLANCLAKEKAHRHGAWEGLMLRGLGAAVQGCGPGGVARAPLDVEDFCAGEGELAAASPGDDCPGWVSEGASANLFIVGEGAVATPPVVNILPGVTRGIALELAATAGFEACEKPVSARALLMAQEVFLTSTVGEIMPVVRVDGHSVGEGAPGPITRRLEQMYEERYRAELGL
ncbi:MAG: aminotransferase class IV [Clostridia bacterium]|nr:aminotransferase class IV [Clostridia bacterium]